MSIQIVVPVWNRKKITELSLYSTNKYKGEENELVVYNDHSTEYDNDFLEPYCDKVIKLPNKLGVQHLRWLHFREFLKTDHQFIYMTDSDVIHDPNYIAKLKELYGKYMLPDKRKMPVCLYNTIYHMQPHNQIQSNEEVILRHTAPGVSMLFDRSQVEKVIQGLKKLGKDPDYGWDYYPTNFLQIPFITSKISYIEHFGESGLHSPKGLQGMDRDRAINPTDYLKEIRDGVINYVLSNGENPINKI